MGSHEDDDMAGEEHQDAPSFLVGLSDYHQFQIDGDFNSDWLTSWSVHNARHPSSLWNPLFQEEHVLPRASTYDSLSWALPIDNIPYSVYDGLISRPPIVPSSGYNSHVTGDNYRSSSIRGQVPTSSKPTGTTSSTAERFRSSIGAGDRDHKVFIDRYTQLLALVNDQELKSQDLYPVIFELYPHLESHLDLSQYFEKILLRYSIGIHRDANGTTEHLLANAIKTHVRELMRATQERPSREVDASLAKTSQHLISKIPRSGTHYEIIKAGVKNIYFPLVACEPDNFQNLNFNFRGKLMSQVLKLASGDNIPYFPHRKVSGILRARVEFLPGRSYEHLAGNLIIFPHEASVRVDSPTYGQVGLLDKDLVAKLDPVFLDDALLVRGVRNYAVESRKLPILIFFYGWKNSGTTQEKHQISISRIVRLKIDLQSSSLTSRHLYLEGSQTSFTSSEISVSRPVPRTRVVGRSSTANMRTETIDSRSENADDNVDIAQAPEYVRPPPVKRTWSNNVKVAVEIILGQALCWWPMAEPVRPDPPGTERFSWTCSCGSEVYFNAPISIGFARSMPAGSTLSPQNSAPQSLPLYNTARASRSSQSQALRNSPRYTPSTQLSPQSNENQGSTQTSQTPGSRQAPSNRPGQFVYWCVNEHASSTHAIEVNVVSLTDHSFLDILLREYTKVAGLWSQFWTMTSCSGVKFTKFRYLYDDLNIVKCIRHGIPDGVEYQYIRGDLSEEHRVCLEAIAGHYLWKHSGVLSGLRRRLPRIPFLSRASVTVCPCTPPSVDPITFLRHVPKKTPDRLKPVMFTEGYGMHAVARLAVVKIAIMFLVWHAGSLAFLGWWLNAHEGDLQNAFTIFFAAVTSFAVYIQILVKFRE